MEKDLYMNELVRLLEETERFIKLNVDNNIGQKKVSVKDLAMLGEIAREEYDIISSMDVGTDDNLGIKDIIGQFISAVDEANMDKMLEKYQILLKINQDYNQDKIKISKLQEVFQADIKMMELNEVMVKLHEDKIKTLQDIVSIDLQIYGEVSQSTLEVLDVQHCELSSNNKVQEKKNVQEKENIQEMEEKNDLESKPAAQHLKSQENTEKSYKANVYMKNSVDKKQTPEIIYGNSPEGILSTLQEWNKGRTDDMQFRTCYISKLNKDTNKYENLAKYDVATGTDITPIYLNLPHLEHSNFLKLVEQIKKDGARYNPIKKNFFVTKQIDLNKFAKYLPVDAHAESSENQNGNKKSVMSKLSQNKVGLELDKDTGSQIKADRDYSR